MKMPAKEPTTTPVNPGGIGKKKKEEENKRNKM
jgi:hypothetical protein